ncbi:MAG: hypothetical protein JO301_02900, partial [Chitinophagaceae bacterium]|nr:hypothetical protein [Chitinophagaceae bacterium]
AKRKLVLDKYLAKLQTERQKPRQRRKKVIRQPIFEKGDCLTFKLKDGNFGGAVVLEAVRNTEHGLNLIATTRINQPHSPTRKDFENAEVLINTFGNWKDDASIQWYSPIRHKEFAHLIEVVDNIRINIDYTQNKYRYGHIADLGIFVIESANQQFKMEETTPRPKKRQTIKELIVKNRWKFW